MEKYISVLLLAIFLIPAVIVGAYGIMSDEKIEAGETPYQYVERITKKAISLSDDIREIAPKLLYTMYPSQRDGIFITKDYLLEDVKPGDFAYENSRTVKKFCEETEIPTYFAIVPTSIAIKQQELPQRAVIFNQKKLIEECYKASGGMVKGVDVYSELFAVRDQYLYYRTEPLNTSLGGYYIYHSVMKCMRENPLPISDFSVFHRQGKLLGSFAERVNLRGIQPDIASIYEYQGDKKYSMLHIKGRDVKKYYDLTSRGYYEDGFVTINGGPGPRIEISSNEGSLGNLLLIGDKNAISALPFFAVDFKNVTYIDPARLSLEEILSIELQNYDKAVFCYNSQKITEDIGLQKAILAGFGAK